jgi:hypothetical protein
MLITLCSSHYTHHTTRITLYASHCTAGDLPRDLQRANQRSVEDGGGAGPQARCQDRQGGNQQV